VQFASRHLLALLIVLAAALMAGGLLLFARPEYHPRYESKMIDFSHEQYFNPAKVQRVFADHGVRLRKIDAVASFVFFVRPGSSGDAKGLQVSVAPRNGKGSWGPELEPYDARFGNVLVTYGGSDGDLLRRVKSAVSSIRNGS
jgi:hypothetical protein